MSNPVYIPEDAPVMSDLRILVGGLPNTGKSTVAVLLASFLRNHGFPDVVVADDEPYDFDKLAACEMSLRDKRPSIVIETLLMRRNVHLADSVVEAIDAAASVWLPRRVSKILTVNSRGVHDGMEY